MSGRREIEKILEQSPSSIKRSKLLGKETVTGTELQREEVFGLGRGGCLQTVQGVSRLQLSRVGTHVGVNFLMMQLLLCHSFSREEPCK